MRVCLCMRLAMIKNGRRGCASLECLERSALLPPHSDNLTEADCDCPCSPSTAAASSSSSLSAIGVRRRVLPSSLIGGGQQRGGPLCPLYRPLPEDAAVAAARPLSQRLGCRWPLLSLPAWHWL